MAFSFEFDHLLCKLQKRIYFVCWNKNFIGDLKSKVNFAQYREYRSIFLQRLCSSPSITLFYRPTSFCIKNETSIDHIVEIINNTRVTCKAKLTQLIWTLYFVPFPVLLARNTLSSRNIHFLHIETWLYANILTCTITRNKFIRFISRSSNWKKTRHERNSERIASRSFHSSASYDAITDRNFPDTTGFIITNTSIGLGESKHVVHGGLRVLRSPKFRI